MPPLDPHETSCQPGWCRSQELEYQGDLHGVALDGGIGIAVHLVHDLAHDKEAQAVAAVALGIGAAPEALEDVYGLGSGQGVAGVLDGDELDTFLLRVRGKMFLKRYGKDFLKATVSRI